jgi:CobQ-like glutamine amidotransferase family enzyme
VVRIGHLYPEVLGTYGDSGNVEVLHRRLDWRGIRSEIVVIPLGSRIPSGIDLLVVGGGEDDAQTLVAADLAKHLPAALEAGCLVFAVCAGLQLLGHTFQTAAGSTVAGAGVLDAVSTTGHRRAIGEVVAVPTDPTLPRISGFTNHGGVTVLGEHAAPLAKVWRGPANHPLSRDEGAVQGQVMATYLHGPVLARNPALADHLLHRASGLELDPLPDIEVARLRRERLRTRWW